MLINHLTNLQEAKKEIKVPKLKRALIKHLSVYDWLRFIRQQN